MWLDSDGHGINGAPYDMKDVYEDMEACQNMILELYIRIKQIFFGKDWRNCKMENEKITEEYIEKCKKAYLKLQEDAIAKADKEFDKYDIPKEKREYCEWIAAAECDANTEEVVGFYLVNREEGQTPYEHWHENTDYLFENGTVTKQDEEVEEILKIIG